MYFLLPAVDGKPVLKVYHRSLPDGTLSRRSYWRLQFPHMVLVHYHNPSPSKHKIEQDPPLPPPSKYQVKQDPSQLLARAVHVQKLMQQSGWRLLGAPDLGPASSNQIGAPAVFPGVDVGCQVLDLPQSGVPAALQSAPLNDEMAMCAALGGAVVPTAVALPSSAGLPPTKTRWRRLLLILGLIASLILLLVWGGPWSGLKVF